MRTLGVVLVTLLSILPAPIAAQPEYPAPATIRGENIWLRVDPAEDTEVVAYLQRGDQIRVTADATLADGDAFYPIEVVATGETGWVRELAIDPTSFTPLDQLPVVEVNAPAPVDTGADVDQPRRNRNRQTQPETEVVAVDVPARRNNARGANADVPAVAATGDLNCEDFQTQADAQAYFDSQGWSATNDPHRLDQGGAPGVPCESLP